MKSFAALLALIVAVPAGAAPLCHDCKGLFTPCPPAVTRAYRAKKVAAEQAEAPAVAETATTAGGTRRVRSVRAARPAKPGLIAKTHLCRDSKGLFTPCPR